MPWTFFLPVFPPLLFSCLFSFIACDVFHFPVPSFPFLRGLSLSLSFSGDFGVKHACLCSPFPICISGLSLSLSHSLVPYDRYKVFLYRIVHACFSGLLCCSGTQGGFHSLLVASVSVLYLLPTSSLPRELDDCLLTSCARNPSGVLLIGL